MSRYHEAAAYLTDTAEQALMSIDEQQGERFLRILRGGRRSFAYGVGRSSMVVRSFAMRLNHLGCRVYTIGETITPAIHADDTVLLLSGSGTTDFVVRTGYTIAEKIGATILAVTANPDSPLVELAKECIILDCGIEDRKTSLAPLGTLFEGTAWLLFDALVARMMELKQEDETSMSDRHSSLF